MASIDGVSEDDLHAYIDNQLDVAQRVEVAAYLAKRPEEAARVMADLRSRDELRMALATKPAFIRPATGNAARKIEGALTRRAWVDRFRPAIAAAVLMTVGWFSHAQFGPQVNDEASLPSYVEAAFNARQASLLRAAMYSQPEAPAYDRAELLSATAITMPELPADWIVTDVQVFPSQFGPSIGMEIQAKPYGTLSLFSVRPGRFAVSPVTTAQMGDVAGAYWQIGDIAYALLGDEPPAILGTAAAGLADTLY